MEETEADIKNRLEKSDKDLQASDLLISQVLCVWFNNFDPFYLSVPECLTLYE